MKKILLVSKIMLISLCLICSITSLRGQNLILNGNFESWTVNVPDSWTTIDTGVTVVPESVIAHGGTKSASVNVTTATQASTDILQSINVVNGLSYNFSVWVYHTEGFVKARLYVVNTAGSQPYSSNTIVNAWQEVTYTFTATTTGAVDIGLRFYDQSGFDGAEIVYVDDYSMVQTVSDVPVIFNIVTNPTYPSPADNVNISADVTYPGTLTVALNWGTSDTAITNLIPMALVSGSTYTTSSTIPQQVNGAIVYFKITAIGNGIDTTITAMNNYNVFAINYDIVNGGFENWTVNTPNDWTTIGSGLTFAQETDTIHGGAKSASVTITSSNQANNDFRQTVYVTAGMNYNVSAYVYNVNSHSRARLYAGTYHNYSDSTIVGTWQQMTYTYVATTSGPIEFGFRFYKPASASNVMYIDDYSFTITTSSEPVNYMENSQLNLYPNPAGNILTIENIENAKSITISNIVGQKMTEFYPICLNKFKINTGIFEPGIYMIIVQNKDGKTNTMKFIKN